MGCVCLCAAAIDVCMCCRHAVGTRVLRATDRVEHVAALGEQNMPGGGTTVKLKKERNKQTN